MGVQLPRIVPLFPESSPEGAQRAPGGFRRRLAAWLTPGVRKALREPFLHFVLLGALIFAAHEFAETLSTRYVITIGPAERLRIYNSYAQQYGVPATPEQMKAMVERYVREEIFLREGVALNLDKDDEIVRRRIAQKYEFLQQDLGVPQEPTARQLWAYYNAHTDRYMTPERRTFTHIFFSADQVGDRAAKAKAQSVLARLGGTDLARAPSLGDTFPGATDSARLSQVESERLFGGDGFAAQVFKAPVGRWIGPIRSGYGWHLVFVSESLAPRLPDLNEIRDQVAKDFKEDARLAQNARGYKALRAKYAVRTLEDKL